MKIRNLKRQERATVASLSDISHLVKGEGATVAMHPIAKKFVERGNDENRIFYIRNTGEGYEIGLYDASNLRASNVPAFLKQRGYNLAEHLVMDPTPIDTFGSKATHAELVFNCIKELAVLREKNGTVLLSTPVYMPSQSEATPFVMGVYTPKF